MPEIVPEIVVVGSVNVDLVATVPRLPRPGETVLAGAYAEYPGGKGANQAIAAARLGRRVAFVGRTGEDAEADLVRSALAAEGVDVTPLRPLSDVETGRALIAVDAQAENSIVVVPGANACLMPENVSQEERVLDAAAVVVAQLEIPLDTVRAAARLARGRFVFNPAPAQPLDAELLGLVDVLVVNEGEFEVVGGHAVPADLDELGPVLARAALPCSVVITLGARGAAVWDGGDLALVPAPPVTVVDTTGAGDTFVGALADALVRGSSLRDAARWAVTAASLSTGSLGATTGMPTSEQVAALVGHADGVPPLQRAHVT